MDTKENLRDLNLRDQRDFFNHGVAPSFHGVNTVLTSVPAFALRFKY
jgi:hypothetical protein